MATILLAGCEYSNWNLKNNREEEPDQNAQLLLRVQTLETEKELLQKENSKLRAAQAEREAEVSTYAAYNQLKELHKYLLQKYAEKDIAQKFSKTLPQVDELINAKSYKDADAKMNKLLRDAADALQGLPAEKTGEPPAAKTPAKITAGPNLIELRDRLDAVTDGKLKRDSRIEGVELIYNRALDLAKQGDNVKSEDLAFQGIQTLKQALVQLKPTPDQIRISDKIMEVQPGLYSEKPAFKTMPVTEKKTAASEIKPVSKPMTQREKVNINTASLLELQGKLGLDAVVAEGIIWYRDNVSTFEMVEELKIVPEINEQIYSVIKDYIVIE